MAGNGIGFSFQPGSQQIPVGERSQAGGGPQSAVQVKSFTLPNRFVPGQIAPQALLQSPGGGGQGSADIFRRLMSLFAPQGQQQGVPTLGQPPLNHTQPVPMDGRAPWADIGGLLGGQPAAPSPTPNDGTSGRGPGAPPRIIPGEGEKGVGSDPYHDPANFAPAPTNPVAPINIPAQEGYHFGTTPPAPNVRSPLGAKFDGYEGFNF